MRVLRTLSLVLPAILAILATSYIFQRIVGHNQVVTSPDRPTASRFPLPHGTLADLQTNQDEYAAVIKGKVLLVYLTTDCDACKKEISNISRAVSSLNSKVAIYGVYVEERDSVRAFLAANQMNFPILLDDKGRILSRLGFKYMPTKMLLQDGIVTKVWYGSSPDKEALIRDVGEIDIK